MWLLRRCVIAPAMIGLAVVLWSTLPLWLIVAAALAPCCPAGGGRCGCCGCSWWA